MIPSPSSASSPSPVMDGMSPLPDRNVFQADEGIAYLDGALPDWYAGPEKCQKAKPRRQKTDKAVEVLRDDHVIARFRTQKECAQYLRATPEAVSYHCNKGGGTCNGLVLRPLSASKTSNGEYDDSYFGLFDGAEEHRPAKRPQLKPETVAFLREWLLSPEHVGHPYPNQRETEYLMERTGLDKSQLKHWFNNARTRILKPMMEKGDIKVAVKKRRSSVMSEGSAGKKRCSASPSTPTKKPTEIVKTVSPSPTYNRNVVLTASHCSPGKMPPALFAPQLFEGDPSMQYAAPGNGAFDVLENQVANMAKVDNNSSSSAFMSMRDIFDSTFDVEPLPLNHGNEPNNASFFDQDSGRNTGNDAGDLCQPCFHPVSDFQLDQEAPILSPLGTTNKRPAVNILSPLGTMSKQRPAVNKPPPITPRSNAAFKQKVASIAMDEATAAFKEMEAAFAHARQVLPQCRGENSAQAMQVNDKVKECQSNAMLKLKVSREASMEAASAYDVAYMD